MSSAVETARPVIDEAGQELTVTLPGSSVYLNADLTRLAQVFSNLLINSAKYTERGGRIWLSAERRGGEVAVTVLFQITRAIEQALTALKSGRRMAEGKGVTLEAFEVVVGLKEWRKVDEEFSR